MNKLSYLASILAVVVASSASAQYAGPSSAQPLRSVLEVTKNPVDDTEVILRGFLIKKLGDENYLFSDGTGEIRVEIDLEDFPRENVTEKTKVEIRGEVEKDMMSSPEINVETITIVMP